MAQEQALGWCIVLADFQAHGHAVVRQRAMFSRVQQACRDALSQKFRRSGNRINAGQRDVIAKQQGDVAAHGACRLVDQRDRIAFGEQVAEAAAAETVGAEAALLDVHQGSDVVRCRFPNRAECLLNGSVHLWFPYCWLDRCGNGIQPGVKTLSRTRGDA